MNSKILNNLPISNKIEAEAECEEDSIENERKRTRYEVQRNIVKNADFMKKKHEKHRKRKVNEFDVANKVVFTNKQDRRNATLRNIPCVIINKITSNPLKTMYRLQCEAGVISKYVDGSMLGNYYGKVKTGNRDKKISIREAAR